MRFMGGLAVALLTASTVAAVAAEPASRPFVVEAERGSVPGRSPTRRVSAQAPARYRRSRGTQAKPRRSSNRLTISRRTRRRHRRSRRAA